MQVRLSPSNLMCFRIATALPMMLNTRPLAAPVDGAHGKASTSIEESACSLRAAGWGWVVVGTWTRDEATRLARIRIDLPTGLDRDWRIDVRKSQARPPGALRARLTAIAGRCREEAREVFAFRGQGPRVRGATEAVPAVWLGTPGPQGLQYRINRDHPVIAACRKASGSLRPLNAVLSIIERSVPVERIWLEVSESEGCEIPVLDAEEVAQLGDQLQSLGSSCQQP